jgi:carbon-monoxide dehydrogenase medium subunit
MKPARFDYRAVATLEALLAQLAELGDDAQILAGGQSLVPMLNMRAATPAVLLDINPITSLAGVRLDGDHIEIGALTRQRALEASPEVAAAAPLLARALPHVAHPAIRHRGTIGGSVALADPAAELPACCVCLGAELTLASTRGRRTVPAPEFFRGAYATARRPDEALVAIRLPRAPAGERVAFHEVARRHGDFAIVGVAARGRAGGGRLAALSLCVFGMGDHPALAASAARLALDDGPGTSAAALSDAIARDIAPIGDPVNPPALRRHLAGVLAKRAIDDLVRA